MVVSLDKFTAVKMYDKVQRLWKEEIKGLLGRIKKSKVQFEKKRLQGQLDYMRSVEMAVIVSAEADEEKKFVKQKLTIKPHRDRMNRLDEHGHDVEFNFKDPANPLELVFVCAMWLTGFDAPTLSTLYLDKPMKDHTLMQTIARANRVTSWKVIVDEAHRTQYKSLAENMRAGLKNAQFMAFTGTPLLGRDRKTNQWFGDYVSEYNFQQSMDDGATVPLFYEKRVPQVLIQNENLSDELAEIVEDENLDEAQRSRLENKFATEIEVIKREDRLETIAKDIVYHFPRRGYALYISSMSRSMQRHF